MSEPLAMTEAEMDAILNDCFPGPHVTRRQCGRCGEWSDWFLFVGVAGSPPGWQEPAGQYAYAKASLCSSCVKEGQ